MGNLKLALILISALTIGVAVGAIVSVMQEAQPPKDSEEPEGNHFSPFSTALMTTPDHLDWGVVTVGVPKTRNVTLTSVNATSPIQLTMSTVNASANLLNYTVVWDAENVTLQPQTSITANFTLTIHTADVTETADFTFDIIIASNL